MFLLVRHKVGINHIKSQISESTDPSFGLTVCGLLLNLKDYFEISSFINLGTCKNCVHIFHKSDSNIESRTNSPICMICNRRNILNENQILGRCFNSEDSIENMWKKIKYMLSKCIRCKTDTKFNYSDPYRSKCSICTAEREEFLGMVYHYGELCKSLNER